MCVLHIEARGGGWILWTVLVPVGCELLCGCWEGDHRSTANSLSYLAISPAQTVCCLDWYLTDRIQCVYTKGHLIGPSCCIRASKQDEKNNLKSVQSSFFNVRLMSPSLGDVSRSRLTYLSMGSNQMGRTTEVRTPVLLLTFFCFVLLFVLAAGVEKLCIFNIAEKYMEIHREIWLLSKVSRESLLYFSFTTPESGS